MTEATGDDYKPVRAVYTGVADLQSGKLGDTFTLINEDGTLGKELCFAKGKRSRAIGGIYEGLELKAKPDGGYTIRGIDRDTFAGPWNVDADVAMWRARDDQVEQNQKRARLEKAVKGKRPYLAEMLPMRRLYANARTHTDRAAIREYVLSLLSIPPAAK